MKRAHLHARRSLLFGLIGYLCISAAVCVWLRVDPSLFRDSYYAPRLRAYRRQAAALPGALTVVQLGSSRTGSGLIGKEVEADLGERLGRPVVLFNMGLPGSGPVRTRVNLEWLLNDGVRPDVLLVEVLPPLLSEDWPCEIPESQLPSEVFRREELPLVRRVTGEPRDDWSGESLAAQLVPAHTHRLSLVNATVPTLLPITSRDTFLANTDERGWASFPPLSEQKRRRMFADARLEYEARLAAFRLSERRLGLIGETIDVARRQGMAVALVLMPEGPAFRGWYPAGTWEQIAAAIADVAARHEVPLLDLRGSRPEQDFVDSHHLTTAGAKAYTRDLAGRIEPLLREVAGRRP